MAVEPTPRGAQWAHALTSLCELPEFSREYVGKVKLAYLDQPFKM